LIGYIDILKILFSIVVLKKKKLNLDTKLNIIKLDKYLMSTLTAEKQMYCNVVKLSVCIPLYFERWQRLN